jgi:hypothetical protein
MSKVYSKKDKPEIKGRIVEENKKFGSVVIEYLTGEEAGKTTNISNSTLKRWWRVEGEVDDAQVEEERKEADEAAKQAEIDAQELVTKIKPTKKKKPTINAIDRDSKVEYLNVLAERYGATVDAKPTDKYEIRVYRDGKRLGHICIKLRKFVMYTKRAVIFKDADKFTVEQVTSGHAKIECLPEDALLEAMFVALFESEE